MSGLAKKGFAAWLILTVLSMVIVTLIYMFSDGSKDVVEKLRAKDVFQTELVKYLPRNTNANDKVIDGLNQNPDIEGVSVGFGDVAKFTGTPESTNAFGKYFSKKAQDYFDLVEIRFLYKKEITVVAEFVVAKGRFLFFLDSDRNELSKPWATIVGLLDLKENRL